VYKKFADLNEKFAAPKGKSVDPEMKEFVKAIKSEQMVANFKIVQKLVAKLDALSTAAKDAETLLANLDPSDAKSIAKTGPTLGKVWRQTQLAKDLHTLLEDLFESWLEINKVKKKK
jgi:hypothetical protein